MRNLTLQLIMASSLLIFHSANAAEKYCEGTASLILKEHCFAHFKPCDTLDFNHPGQYSKVLKPSGDYTFYTGTPLSQVVLVGPQSEDGTSYVIVSKYLSGKQKSKASLASVWNYSLDQDCNIISMSKNESGIKMATITSAQCLNLPPFSGLDDDFEDTTYRELCEPFMALFKKTWTNVEKGTREKTIQSKNTKTISQ